MTADLITRLESADGPSNRSTQSAGCVMTEGTDMNQIEKVARVGMALCQNGLGNKQCPCAESGVFKCADEFPGQQAKAAIAAMQPAPQEPVGSAAEITRLTEALRAAEEREKGLREALFNATALIGHSVPMDTTAFVAGEQLTAQGVWLQGRDALAGAKP